MFHQQLREKHIDCGDADCAGALPDDNHDHFLWIDRQLREPSGTYATPQMVSISDATPGALIYYTTDGTVPSRPSATVSPGGSILVSTSETVKALAVATGYTTSPEGVATYTITPSP